MSSGSTADGQATYHEVEARSITRVPGTADPWFLGRYGMNLYRGCEHGCVYCDGRAEKYHVSGDFARQITVKRNTVEVLDRELSRIREPGFVMLGGGVCDAYQPAELSYRLARGVLELALKHKLPVHVLSSFDWRSLEQEFRAAVRDRSILELDGMTAEALDVVEDVLATLPGEDCLI
jgi:DNA repair photolyase